MFFISVSRKSMITVQHINPQPPLQFQHIPPIKVHNSNPGMPFYPQRRCPSATRPSIMNTASTSSTPLCLNSAPIFTSNMSFHPYHLQPPATRPSTTCPSTRCTVSTSISLLHPQHLHPTASRPATPRWRWGPCWLAAPGRRHRCRSRRPRCPWRVRSDARSRSPWR